MTTKEVNQVKDESNDRKYFLMRPTIVKLKARNIYDIAVWDAVKEVAGENGECFLSSEDLAALAMVSVGQLSDSRKYLIEVGLLEGEIRKRSEHGQAMWHLRIPDLWKENITLMSSLSWHQKLQAFQERGKKQPAFERLHFTKPSYHEEKPSYHEGKPSPHEGFPPQKPSPHETEEDHNRIKYTEEKEPAPPKNGQDKQEDFLTLATKIDEQQRKHIEPIRVIAEKVASLLGTTVPDYEREWNQKWEPPIAEWLKVAGGDVDKVLSMVVSLCRDPNNAEWIERATTPASLSSTLRKRLNGGQKISVW